MNMKSMKTSMSAALTTIILSFACGNAEAQTIAHWTFDEGADFLSDMSGNGHNLANVGVTSVADDYDGAATTSQGSAYFNGVDAWMSTINTVDLSPHNAVRITWWMKNEMAIPNVGVFMEHSNNYNSNLGGFVFATNENGLEDVEGGHAAVRFNDSSHTELIPHSQDVWEKFSLEIDRVTTDQSEVMRLYHNDTLLPDMDGYSNTHAGNHPTLANDIMYVGSRANTAHFYKGGLDEVKIEDLDRGQTVAHWRFEEGTDFLSDSSGNGNHLSGTALSVSDDFDGTGTDSNGSVLFNGSSDSLQTVSSLDLSNLTHVKFSWWQKTDSTAGILFEQSADYNHVNGAVVVGPNISGDPAAPGAASMHLHSTDPLQQFNAEAFAHDTTMQWEQFTCEIDMAAADPADVVVMTRGGTLLPDATAWAQHGVNSPAVTFIDDFLNFGVRADILSNYFKGNLDDVMIEAIVPGGTVPGDANFDGVVDAADATVLADNWQTATGATWAQGDFNNDGAVNDIDATILASNWQTTGTNATVPEPGMFAFLIAMLAAPLCRRKGRRRG